MPGFSRFARNSLWMVTEKSVRMCVGTAMGVWLARHLGPGDFGILSYAIALVAICGPIARAGLDTVLIRELIHHEGDRDTLLRAAFWIRFAASGLSAMGLALYIVLVVGWLDNTKAVVLLMVTASLLFQPWDVLELVFQARVDARASSICRIIQTLLMGLVRAVLILAQAGVAAFAAVVALETLLLAVLLLAGAHLSGLPSLMGRIVLKRAVALLRESWPLLLSGIAVMFYMRVDQVMIEAMLGSSAVGMYSAALRISEVWFAILAVFSTSLLPAVVGNVREDSGGGYGRMQAMLFVLIWANVILAVLVTLVGDWLVPALFGPEYAGAVPVLKIHIWTGIFVSLGLLSGNWLVAQRLQILALRRTVAGAVVNVILNFWLIRTHGIAGAAAASLVSQVIAAFLVDFLSVRTRQMFWTKLQSFISPRPLI